MKKRISFLLAAVMLAITPAGTALGSESDTDVILSEDLMISDETLAADEGESESLSGGDAALIDVIEVQGEDTENETENETEADTGAALVDETGAAEEDVLIVGIEEADAEDIPAEISEAAESEASEILDEAAAVDDTVTAVSDLTPEATNNTGDQNYSVWSSPVYSYLETVSGGFMRVEYTGSVVVVEYYNSSFTLTSKKYVTRELTYFGGFYAGSDAYYLVFGQSNTDEDDSAEVVRVVKYSTDWVRQGAASLYGANTTYPFDAGSLRMAESGGYLYIRTSHEMYTSSDGLNHQANLMIEVDESSMTVTDSYSAVMNNSVGYVSHSFNQFILVDDSNNLIAVDHGDAYPRAAILFRYSKQAGISTFSGSTSSVKLLSFQGATGNNATGASLGGLEYSSSSYLVAGNSVTQDSNWSSHTARNIFVTVTSRSSLSSTSVKWITDYDTDGSISASTPQLVKLGTDSFLLLWTTKEYTVSGNTSSNQSKLHYVYLDGQGNTTSEIYTVNGQLSNCKPTVSGGSVYWYVTGDADSSSSSTTPYFYTIRSDGSFSVKTTMEAPSFTAVPVVGGIEVSWNAVSGASGYYVHRSGSTTTVSGSSTTSVTISASSDTTYMIWVEAYSGNAKSLAADKLEFYYLAAPSVTLSNTDDAIQVSWKSVTGAEGYRVYRKTNSGSYTLVKTTTELSFTDSDLTGGSSYTYQVYAYSDSGTSGGSTEKTAVYVAAPVLQSVSIANGGVQVTWETATGATSYRVYYKRSSNSSYSSQTYTAGSGSTQSAVLGVSSGYTYDVYVKAYIDSTGGKASSTLSVEYLSAPVISSLSSTSSGICVTWGTVSGASGYKVYRKTGSGSYSLVKTTTGTSFTDSGLAGGNSYTYQVYAYSDNGASNGSTERTAVYVPTPTLKSVSIANGGVQVTWGTVTGATSYRVYYKRSSNSSYSSQTYTAGSGSTQSEVLSVSSGYTYDIYVKAYIDSTGGAASSSLSIIYLSAPVISSLSSTSSGICVTWGTVSGASGYKVYRKTGSGSYSLVKTTTGTSFTDSGLTGGNSYTYQVYAYSGSWTSNGSTEKTAVYVPTPALKSVSNVNGGVQVTWGTVTGATSYRVYYKRSSDSSYWYQTFTAESGSTQSATLSVSSGYTYDIYVKAYIDSTGGADSSTSSIAYLAAPAISSLSSTSSGIYVAWGTVSGASGYKVYRKTGSGSYSLVKTTTGTSFTDSGLTGGNSYTYQVYAYSGSGTSSGSTEKTAVYVPAPALKNVSNANGGVQVTWGTVTGATSYRVYYKRSSDSGYWYQTFMAESGSTQSAVLGVSSGYTYNVYVKAYIDSTGGADSSTSSIAYLAAPAISSLSSTSSGIYVAWGTVSGASGYKVYRKTGSGSYSLVKTTTDRSWTDTGTSAGNTYTYQVYAYSGTTTSAASAEKSVTRPAASASASTVTLAAGKITSLTNTSAGIKIQWTAVSGADGYYIYRKTSSGKYSRIKTIKSASTVSYTDKKIADNNGTTYIYKVVPYSGSTKGTGTASTTVRLTRTSLTSLKNSAAGKMKVKWTAVTGVTGYQIQYSTSKTFASGNKTKKVSGASSVKKTLSSLTKGKTYYVRIRTYKTVNGKTYYSAWSSKLKVKITK